MDRYEEALERAKKGLPIDEVFPELKESKDERIRKALIHLINEQDGFLTAIDGISVKDIITYLEKQKEQKPAEWSEEDEKMFKWISVRIQEHHMSLEYTKQVRNALSWLKSLRPQLIQDKFDSAMHVADKFEEGYKAGVYDTKAKSWKPSQQQMANLINVRDHVAQASGHWGESLSSLIDDLKKL